MLAFSVVQYDEDYIGFFAVVSVENASYCDRVVAWCRENFREPEVQINYVPPHYDGYTICNGVLLMRFADQADAALFRLFADALN